MAVCSPRLVIDARGRGEEGSHYFKSTGLKDTTWKNQNVYRHVLFFCELCSYFYIFISIQLNTYFWYISTIAQTQRRPNACHYNERESESEEGGQ